MCTTCLTLFLEPSPPLSKPCPSCDSAHFCNRLCLGRAKEAAAHHDLLCPGANPSCWPLLKYIRDNGARHLAAVARIIALWRGAKASGDVKEATRIEKRVWTGMARINQLDKEKERREWYVSALDLLTSRSMVAETRLAELHHTHQLLLQALHPSSPDARFQKLIRKTTISEAEVDRWFSFDSYLELLGLAGINQESSGGLYALHAHLNHSCEPNLQAGLDCFYR